MFRYKQIIKNFLENNDSNKSNSDDSLSYLIKLNLKTNKELWSLEDSARMINLGVKHVAKAKIAIDKVNQARNDLIRKIDVEISRQMNIVPLNKELYYSESPGMIIDRLAILYIKFSTIKNLISLIKEQDLKKEYKEKQIIVRRQFNDLSKFLDFYFKKLKEKEAFFEIQQSVKIYNDDRIKKYIKSL